MLFNSLQFAVFFAFVLGLYRLLQPPAQRALLLSASLVFYFAWVPIYLPLLVIELAVNYALLRGIRSPRWGRACLVASIAFTLGLLVWFKYAAFLLTSFSPLLASLSAEPPGIPSIVLPLGISFFSFQIIALAVDTWRSREAPPPSFQRYALFISFFPQLIAGPILRGGEFLPQLEAGGRIERERTRRGLWLITSGVVKKMILADCLLAPFVDEVYRFPGLAPGPAQLIALYSFAFQIYFDFSGYTDMARGLAKLLGFELPRNFTEPYLSRSPAEFWRRWHITLSSWLRDYLYIPLGGNRAGDFATIRNLIVTMLLGGLWHGAGWNFVIWGGLHGVALAAHRLVRGERRFDEPASRMGAIVAAILTFHWTCLLWTFFRLTTPGDAIASLAALGSGWEIARIPVLQAAVVALCAALHPLERLAREHVEALGRRVGWGPWGALGEGLVYGAVTALAFAAGAQGGDFIYFQF